MRIPAAISEHLRARPPSCVSPSHNPIPSVEPQNPVSQYVCAPLESPAWTTTCRDHGCAAMLGEGTHFPRPALSLPQ
eukprot:6478104-Amphidinium_carterae.1